MLVPTDDPDALRAALDDVVCDWTAEQREATRARARSHALRFDRFAVFDALFGPVSATAEVEDVA